MIAEAEPQVLPDILDAFAQVRLPLPEHVALVLLQCAAGCGTQPDWHGRGDVVFAPERDSDERPILIAAAGPLLLGHSS
ncbi:hypothetical protein ACFVXQ_23790 [Kitasatospora sp. NPDC058263]